MNIDADDIMRRKVCRVLAVDDYIELLDGVEHGRIDTADFQHRFNRFCMIRRDARWRRIYYGLFSAFAKLRDEVEFEDILFMLDRDVRRKLGEARLEVSFSSKMLAFLRPYEFPIWDRWVVDNLDAEIGDLKLSLNSWSDIRPRECEAVEKFSKMTQWFHTELKKPSVKEALKRFDAYLPQEFVGRIPEIKKLDWLLWAKRGT